MVNILAYMCMHASSDIIIASETGLQAQASVASLSPTRADETNWLLSDLASDRWPCVAHTVSHDFSLQRPSFIFVLKPFSPANNVAHGDDITPLSDPSDALEKSAASGVPLLVQRRSLLIRRRLGLDKDSTPHERHLGKCAGRLANLVEEEGTALKNVLAMESAPPAVRNRLKKASKEGIDLPAYPGIVWALLAIFVFLLAFYIGRVRP